MPVVSSRALGAAATWKFSTGFSEAAALQRWENATEAEIMV
jgi:hypothetical protein